MIKPNSMADMGESAPVRPAGRNGPVGRYAPSPTGALHAGNLRTALLAHHQMEALGGLMILRIEDIDRPRTVAGAEQAILRDLERIGLEYHEGPAIGGPCGPYRQSEREAIYQACFERLAAEGWIYPCRCSRKDLMEASAPHGPDGFIYPGTCRPPEMKPVEREELRQGDTAWRLRLDRTGLVRWRDGLLGPQCDRPSAGGDFVVRRRDGLWAYQFACAVDDWLMGVSHVLRGADLISSTARQLAVISALGGTPPRFYLHVPLACGDDGARLSKRSGSEGIMAQGVSLPVIRRGLVEQRTIWPANCSYGNKG